MRKTLIALSSCQYPADFFRYRCGYQSLGAVATLFADERYRDMHRVMLLAGDSIYSDPTAGFLDAVDPHERFTQQYHTLRNSWAWKLIDSDESLYSIDDHELVDNWAPLDASHPDQEQKKELETTLKEGRRAFIQEMNIGAQSKDDIYFGKQLNGLPIFVMDTRTEREARNVTNIHEANLISNKQLKALEDWIDQCAQQDKGKSLSEIPPKFILSGSMMTPRLRSVSDRWNQHASGAACLRSDGWDGFPKSQHQVLAKILRSSLQRVVFLSGDAHIPCLCNMTVSDGQHSITMASVHGSALNAPLPFANAMAEDFARSETFELCSDKASTTLTVTTDTQFPDVGDGFSVIKVSEHDLRYRAEVSFAGRLNDYTPDAYHPIVDTTGPLPA